MIQHFPAEYNQVIAQAKDQKTPTEPQELKVFSTDHKSIGLRMVARWKLPYEVADGISFYTEPHNSSLKSTQILAIASHHIKQKRIGFCGDWVPYPIAKEVYTNLRLTRMDVERLVEEVLEVELAKADDFIKGN